MVVIVVVIGVDRIVGWGGGGFGFVGWRPVVMRRGGKRRKYCCCCCYCCYCCPAAAAAAADGVELEPGTPAAAEEPFVAGAAAGGDGPRSAALAATC